MGYASLLVHIESGSAGRARLQLASDLGRRFDTTLIGIAALAVQPPPIVDAYGGAIIDAEMMTDEREQLEAELGVLVADARDQLAEFGEPASFTSRTKREPPLYAEEAPSLPPAASP